MNKILIVVTFLLLNSFNSVCQENNSRIAYISKIPIVVETGFVISDSVFNLSNNKNFISLVVIAKKVKIEFLNSDQLFDGIKIINSDRLSKNIRFFEYCIISNINKIGSWKHFMLNDSSQNKNKNILVDTSLKNGESILVVFRLNKKDTLNLIEIKRKQFTPRVLYYFNENKSYKQDEDTSSPSIIKDNLTKIDENNRTIYTKPNTTLQIKLENIFPKWDSSITYKIESKNNPGHWIKTTNQIKIDSLSESSGPITLSLRYFNCENIINYEILVRPLWYKTVIGKLKISIAILVTLLILIYFASKYRIKKEKDKNQLLLVKLKIFQSQLNPHFLFNSLSSIQGLVNTNKRIQANYYLSSFSTLMRSVLNYSELDSIPLEHEIKLVTEYVKLEQLRYHFEFEIKLDDKLKLSQIEIPPLLLQPSIENAIKHGLSLNSIEKPKLTFVLNAYKNDLQIKILDNGHGVKYYKEKNKGFGIPLTNNRIKLLNKILVERSIKFEILSSNNGTVSIFYFSNWLSND